MEAAFSSLANRHLLSTTLLSSALKPSDATSLTSQSDSFLQPSQRSSLPTSLVFIDPGVSDYQSLLAGVQPGAEVHLLNTAQDAIAQITQTLLGRTNISSLHIVSHGQAGGLELGTNWLSLDNLRSYSGELQSWSNALTADADILLYGCDVAQGAIGHAFVQQFAQLTGADIAASDNLTGSATLGGDWTLEVNTGAIAASLVFQASAIANYQHILPIDLISTVDLSTPSDTANGSQFRGNISDNGRYVVLDSGASNLVTNDTNRTADVFVRDLQTGSTTLVSANRSGTASGNGASFNSEISGNGRYVAFTSYANDLVTNNINSSPNFFVRDLQTSTTALVNVNSTGTSSNGSIGSDTVRISTDGRYITFTSSANNLVANDTNGTQDVFVRNIATGTTTLVSANSTGTGSGNGISSIPSMTGDGRYITFASTASNLVANDTNGTQDVFVRDMVTGTTTLVSANSTGIGSGNGSSGSANVRISSNGRYVAFTSIASNLVTNDVNGTLQDVFVRDLQTGTTMLVSVNRAGIGSGNGASSAPPSISSDGRYVAFASTASDLVANDANQTGDVFIRDLVTGTTTLASVNSAGTGSGNGFSGNSGTNGNSVRLSSDGRYVAFISSASDLVTNDNNSDVDVFVRDLLAGTTTLISHASTSGSSNGYSYAPAPFSSNGRLVFLSDASNLVPNDGNGCTDAFVYDAATGTTTLVAKKDPAAPSSNSGNSSSSTAPNSISADGRYVVFTSYASNLVPNDTNGDVDVLLRDRTTGITTLISRTSRGTSGNADSMSPSISSDGRYVVYSSNASDLVTGDSNITYDLFLYDRVLGTTTLVSRTSTGTSSNSSSTSAVISSDGRFIAFSSNASNLVVNDSNGTDDVFVWDRQTGNVALISHNSTGSPGNRYSYGPTISNDGRYVAFSSAASDLVTGDGNNVEDVFIWDRQTDSINLVSHTITGSSGSSRFDNPVISGDGNYVAFASDASNLVSGDSNSTRDIFLWERQTGSVTLVSRTSAGNSGNSSSSAPVINNDGRFVAFVSNASNLTVGDSNSASDVYMYDRQTNTVKLVSHTNTGSSGSSYAINPVISADGRYIAFESGASDLVSSDNNGSSDVFVWNRQTDRVSLVSRTNTGNSGDDVSTSPVLSSDGTYLIFTSYASNLVTGDLNSTADVYGFSWTPPTVSINNVSQTEANDGTAVYTFNVRLSEATDQPISVNYATADGTATVADNDYTAVSGVLTFNPGETSKTLTVLVKGDTKVEQDETFLVKLLNPTNATIAPNADAGTGTIVNDDHAQLLWRNSTSGQNAVWQLNGLTVQSTYYLPPVADANWQMVSTADFNRDGVADILWRNQVTGSNAIWQMNSTGFQTSYYINPVADTNWQIVSTADFNRDGIADLLWRNVKTGENSIWQMNGFTVQTTAYINPVADTNWQIVSTADFNRDGIADLLWRNIRTGENSIWQMQGFTVQTAAYINPVADANWQIVSTADFNGDGIADLLWRNSRTGENSIWQMNGLTVQTTAYINPVADTNWQIVGTTDCNGDGIADLLWRNMKTGEDSIWQMNGLTVQTTAYINPVADTNWRVKPFVSAAILTSA